MNAQLQGGGTLPPPDGQAALARDLTRLVEEHDAGGGAGTVLPSTYLEAVLERE